MKCQRKLATFHVSRPFSSAKVQQFLDMTKSELIQNLSETIQRVSNFAHQQRKKGSLPEVSLLYNQRRDGDSNPGNGFAVYTLSRRASSATRASLLTL